MRADDDELVASRPVQPAGELAACERALDDGCDRAEQHVSVFVGMLVVDLPETVEVDEEQGQRRAGIVKRLELREQRAAVREARVLVVEGEVLELRNAPARVDRLPQAQQRLP